MALSSDVIERISTHPQSLVDELSPRGWKQVQEKVERASSGTSVLGSIRTPNYLGYL